METKTCPYCRKGYQQPTGYVPREYPCEDCQGSNVLYKCPVCEDWVGPHELGELDMCGMCEDEYENEEEEDE